MLHSSAWPHSDGDLVAPSVLAGVQTGGFDDPPQVSE